MAPWLWMLLGLALVAAELLAPGGFYLLFFGAGALLVGALSAFGLAGPPAVQWLAFSLLSVVSALLFRKPLLERFKRGLPHRGDDELVGETAIAAETIAAGD